MRDGSQLLVRTWIDGLVTSQTVATREHASAVWGPPISPQYDDDDLTGLAS